MEGPPFLLLMVSKNKQFIILSEAKDLLKADISERVSLDLTCPIHFAD
jgi:hypothetical protein